MSFIFKYYLSWTCKYLQWSWYQWFEYIFTPWKISNVWSRLSIIYYIAFTIEHYVHIKCFLLFVSNAFIYQELVGLTNGRDTNDLNIFLHPERFKCLKETVDFILTVSFNFLIPISVCIMDWFRCRLLDLHRHQLYQNHL